MAIFEQGWPRLEVQAADGTLAHRFPGLHEAPGFAGHLRHGLEELPKQGEAPSWSALHELARDYDGARADETAGRFAGAYRAFLELSREPVTGSLPRLALAGLERIARAAQSSLFAARERARDDPHAAEAVLAGSLASFAGTPYEQDLARVREHLRAHGTFPEIQGGPPLGGESSAH
jgi:hypothetical protein